MNRQYGVIVGRFQVPELHAGHIHLIEEVLKRHPKEVVICLGVTGAAPTELNPLSFDVRVEMIFNRFPNTNITIVKLQDVPNDDHKWSSNLDKLITSKFKGTPVLYASRDSFKSRYHGAFQVYDIEPVTDVSGTDIRNMLVEPKHNAEFRAGIIHSVMSRFPIVYPTVDICCYRLSDSAESVEILLGRKPNEDKWRFPGGFVDKQDKSYLAAARREFIEEVGNIETDEWEFIGSAQIPDPRYIGTKDTIMTSLFMCQYIFGAAKGADDLAEVKWFDIIDLQENYKTIVIPTHHVLVEMLKDETNV